MQSDEKSKNYGRVVHANSNREQFVDTHKGWQFPKMATADEFNHPPWAKTGPKVGGGNERGVISKSNIDNPRFQKALAKENPV